MREIPGDVFWPLRVKVPRDGDHLPMQYLWYWYWQFFVSKGAQQ